MEEMRGEEAAAVLAKNHLGHLGLSNDGRSYVLPLFYVFDGQALYFHSLPGLKEDFARSTKEACFAVTELRDTDDWHSVLAFGPIEKVQTVDDIKHAMERLLTLPLPPDWASGAEEGTRHPTEPLVYLRMVPRRITGRKSRPQPTDEEVDMG